MILAISAKEGREGAGIDFCLGRVLGGEGISKFLASGGRAPPSPKQGKL